MQRPQRRRRSKYKIISISLSLSSLDPNHSNLHTKLLARAHRWMCWINEPFCQRKSATISLISRFQFDENRFDPFLTFDLAILHKRMSEMHLRASSIHAKHFTDQHRFSLRLTCIWCFLSFNFHYYYFHAIDGCFGRDNDSDSHIQHSNSIR